MAATTAVILLATATYVAAAPDPIIETCSQPSTFGCASNSSLQQDLIYTPTASLGGCECNSAFYNAFSSCLACIKSQGESSPEIQNQQDWVKSCNSYGFNFTANPIANATNPSTGPDASSSSSGLSTGAIVGIVIGVVGVLALIGAAAYFKNRKGKNPLERPYTANSGGEYVPTAGADNNNNDNNNNSYHNADYSDSNNYYPDNQYQSQQYGDYNNHINQPYQQSGYENGYNNYGNGYGNEYQNGLYGNNNNNDMMMQPLESYIPPPGSTSPNTAAAVAAAAAAVISTPSPRPSDTFPQSLRSKPTAWNQSELTSGLIGSPNNDKAEFEEGEEVLEPPRSQSRFTRDSDDFTSRRSMTPPRPMLSYRDDFNRPSFEREPRHSGSDRGSISGIGLARSGNDSTSAQDEDASGIEDSPEFARRRARAAELFSAESGRK
ncbi:hypothetical protein CPC16_009047 [Podila verticillata]|nr:hypothetical protein CPC16_009047 [Podila verticillata]